MCGRCCTVAAVELDLRRQEQAESYAEQVGETDRARTSGPGSPNRNDHGNLHLLLRETRNSGFGKLQFPDDANMRLSHETIYRSLHVQDAVACGGAGQIPADRACAPQDSTHDRTAWAPSPEWSVWLGLWDPPEVSRTSWLSAMRRRPCPMRTLRRWGQRRRPPRWAISRRSTPGPRRVPKVNGEVFSRIRAKRLGRLRGPPALARVVGRVGRPGRPRRVGAGEHGPDHRPAVVV